MKRFIMTIMLTCLASLSAITTLVQAETSAPGYYESCLADTGVASSNQTNDGVAILLKQLIRELRELKLEVLKQRIENQTIKIAQLERELQRTRGEQQRLEEQAHSLNLTVAEVDKQLTISVTEAERAELETARTELSGRALGKLQTRQQAIAQQESELNKQLNQEQQRLSQLQREAKKLGTEN